jgi:hypothetical protein
MALNSSLAYKTPALAQVTNQIFNEKCYRTKKDR